MPRTAGSTRLRCDDAHECQPVAIPLNNVVMRGDRLVSRDLSDEQIKAMPEWKKGQQQTGLDPGKTVQVRSASGSRPERRFSTPRRRSWPSRGVPTPEAWA